MSSGPGPRPKLLAPARERSPSPARADTPPASHRGSDSVDGASVASTSKRGSSLPVAPVAPDDVSYSREVKRRRAVIPDAAAAAAAARQLWLGTQ
ncbi:hypothetical protein FOA52_001287 [Chlamydomonas sp. UWO 241]|nr:hypothetical protein FOA52_001287 [Chlamydomonas sp. UWO 241]